MSEMTCFYEGCTVRINRGGSFSAISYLGENLQEFLLQQCLNGTSFVPLNLYKLTRYFRILKKRSLLELDQKTHREAIYICREIYIFFFYRFVKQIERKPS